jgi:hypothetical protein
MKISSFSIHQQWTGWERNQENLFTIASKYKIPMKKFKEVKDLWKENYKTLKKNW